MRFSRNTPGGQMIDALGTLPDTSDAAYGVIAKSTERRVTYGVVYAPDTDDAHDEYANADDLEEAIHEYMEKGELDIRRQHTDEKIGKIVGLMAWPFEAEIELTAAGLAKATRKVVLPAGTVYAAAKWSPEGWEDVKKGKIRGFSMGGAAVRLKEA